jgi:hypothetical protein
VARLVLRDSLEHGAYLGVRREIHLHGRHERRHGLAHTSADHVLDGELDEVHGGEHRVRRRRQTPCAELAPAETAGEGEAEPRMLDLVERGRLGRGDQFRGRAEGHELQCRSREGRDGGVLVPGRLAPELR